MMVFSRLTLRFRRCLLVVMLTACWWLPARSANPNIDSPGAVELSAVLTFGPLYPVDRWLPLRCDVYNPTDSTITGRIVLPGNRSPSTVTLSASVTCPARSRTRVNMFGYFVPDAFSDPAHEAGGQDAPLVVAEFRSDQGALLARCPISGRPASVADREAGGGIGTLLIALASERSGSPDLEVGISLFAKFLGDVSGAAVIPAVVDPARLPADALGLQGAGFVVADLRMLESLSIAKRASLLQYLRQGGVLVVPPASEPFDPAASWLAPWFPVSTVGGRMLDAVPIAADATAQMKFKGFAPITDAIRTRGESVLADEQFAYACFSRVGAGRIAFIAFPLNAIEPTDRTAASVFCELLGLNRQSVRWSDSEFLQERDVILQTMIGKPATSWRAALILVAGYLSGVCGLYLVFRGPLRPIALCVSLGLAACLSIGLIGFTALHSREDGEYVTCGRVAIIDVMQDGFLRQETAAFLGTQPTIAIHAADGATLRAASETDVSPPLVTLPDFSAPTVALRPGRIESVWQSDHFCETSEPLVSCTGRFDAEGLVLTVRNHLDQTLQMPLLIWGDARYKLGGIPPGSTQMRLGERNSPGDFTSSSIVTTDAAQLRGQVLRAVATPRRMRAEMQLQPPRIIGWLERDQDSLIRGTDSQCLAQSQVAVRADVSILPASPGVAFQVNEGLVQFQPGAASGLPYDRQRGQWIQTGQTGEWLVAVAAPGALGRMKPTRLTLTIDVLSPAHRLTLRTGQCANGAVHQQQGGPILARWVGESRRRTVTIQCTESDFDASGWIWLLVQAEAIEQHSGDSSASLWQILSITGSLEGHTP